MSQTSRFVLFTLFALLATLLALFLSPATRTVAAPAPRPPALTAELLGGATWHFEWGEQRDGVIILFRDGTYASCHNPPHGQRYLGRWMIEGQTNLVLTEYAITTYGDLRGPVVYTCRMNTRGFPTITGVCGATPLMLANPDRDE